MFYLILITVVGINIAPFFAIGDPKFFWNAQGLWAQLGILICFAYSFFEKAKYENPKNKALGLLIMWVGILTWFACMIIQKKGSYDVRPLLPFFNFLCLVILYRLIVQYLNIKQIKVFGEVLRYSIIVTIVLSGLQAVGFSQFFSLIYPDYQNGEYVNNLVSGFLGNGTHLSGFLAMCAPLFFKFKKLDILWLLGLVGVLILSGQTKGDVPISGLIVLLSVVLYYTWEKDNGFFLLEVCALLLISAFLYLKVEEWGMFFHSQGRMGWWKDFFFASQRTFITGAGFGSVFMIGVKSKYPMHLHNEYVQFLFEGGLITIILIINFIKNFFQIKKNENSLVFKTIFVGFLVSSCFTYPAHLWLPASYATVSYAMVVALKKEVNLVSYPIPNKS